MVLKGEYDQYVSVDQLRKELIYLNMVIAQDTNIPIEKAKFTSKIVGVISDPKLSKALTEVELRSILDLTKMLASNLKKDDQEINSILTAWELKNKSNWKTHYSSHTFSLFVPHNTLVFLFNWIKSLFVSPDFKPIETQISPELKSIFADKNDEAEDIVTKAIDSLNDPLTNDAAAVTNLI